MLIVDLGGIWTLQDASQPTEKIPAPVPGSVHDALLTAVRVPDVHQGTHERDQLWVGERTWIYTRTFELTAEHLAHEHIDLVAEGLDTFCILSINGQEVARTDNMLRPWRIALSKAYLRCGTNEIELRFTPAVEVMRKGTAARHLPAWNEQEPGRTWGPVGRGYVRKQACQFGWDWGPQCPSAGPWLPLRLECWSVARIQDWRLTQDHLPDGSVRLSLYTQPTSGADLVLSAFVSLAGEKVASISEAFWGGHEWVFTLQNPALWWPNGMGDQPLYDLVIELHRPDGVLLDRRQARIGLRHLELVREPDAYGRSFYFQVNGRPFFAKGSNWIPLDAHPSSKELESRYRRDLQSAVAAHMNLLRVWGGGYFSHDVFYDLCDELGLLVWQDLMFGCGTYPVWDEDFIESVRQETVLHDRRLRHHSCLDCWCGNNELEQGFTAPAWQANQVEPDFQVGKMAWASYFELFDRVLPAALRQADPDTPYLRGSPHSAPEDGRDGETPRSGDKHIWEIWFSSAPFEHYRNYLHRFVSEFGFQSLPDAVHLRAFAPEGEVLAPDSAWLAFRQRSQPGNARIVEITADWFGSSAVTGDFARFCVFSQLTQGLGLKIGMEHWRRLFPRCGGATYWQLNDRWAAPTWATLDHHGRWKASHHLVRKTFAPLAVIGVEDREKRTLTVHLVNDHAEPVPGEFRLVATSCAGVEVGRWSRTMTASARSLPTEVGVFELDRLLPSDVALEDLLIWLQFQPHDPACTPGDNLVLFVRPRQLRLQRPRLEVQITPGEEESRLMVRTGRVPALWVHLRRTEGSPAWLESICLEDEFFHLPPDSAHTVRLRHPGRPAPAVEDLTLVSVADELAG